MLFSCVCAGRAVGGWGRDLADPDQRSVRGPLRQRGGGRLLQLQALGVPWLHHCFHYTGQGGTNFFIPSSDFHLFLCMLSKKYSVTQRTSHSSTNFETLVDFTLLLYLSKGFKLWTTSNVKDAVYASLLKHLREIFLKIFADQIFLLYKTFPNFKEKVSYK